MFRFSIRELMLVTLVVAMGVGWLIDHRQQDQEIRSGKTWRLRAGTLEHFVLGHGWEVRWGDKTVSAKDPSGSWIFTPCLDEPSPIDD